MNDKVEVEIEPFPDYVNRKLRADIDNYGKLILDGLNGIAFHDDSQIVVLHMEKV